MQAAVKAGARRKGGNRDPMIPTWTWSAGVKSDAENLLSAFTLFSVLGVQRDQRPNYNFYERLLQSQGQ